MKYKKYFLILLVLFLTSSCASNKNNLKDDYYDYINKNIINVTKIEENEVGWSTFTIAQDKVDKKVSNMIQNIVSNPSNSKENKISSLYNLLIDTNTRNRNGITPLEPYLNLINSSSTIEEFMKNAMKIEIKLNIDIFTRITVLKDFKDNSKNIIYFYPISFDYGLTSDYYINSDYLYYHALLKQYNIKLLKQYGYSKEEAKESASLVDEFYKSIAEKSKTSKDLNDVESYYNIINKEELQNIYTNLNIDYYLTSMNISNINNFSIVDKENYQALNSYLTNENLKTLKEYVKLKILQNYALYASEDYANLIYELNNKLEGLEQDDLTKEEKAEDIIKNYFSYDIDKYYTDAYFREEEKEYINELINDILEYYKKELDNNTWLSNTTKEKAKLKLDNITINIGMPNNYSNYSDNYTIDSKISLIENMINMNKTLSEYTLSKLDSNEIVTALSQTTVNAYYNPQDNSINFPAATALLFNINNTYYQNLGSIGMVIAHEITHAFDSNGAKFDENGNLSNWWTEDDYLKFNDLKEKVIEYYNKYEVLDGLYLDGKLTVDENIADLGSLSCIVSLAQEKNATTEELQEMFSSFANMWASAYTEDYQKLLLLQDNHSPNKYRVNATLSSTNAFYEAYNIGIFDEMYINPKERVKVW